MKIRREKTLIVKKCIPWVLRVEEWVWQYLTPEFTSMRILRIE